MTLAWTPSPSDDVAFYEISYGAPAVVTTVASPATGASVTGLSPGTAYTSTPPPPTVLHDTGAAMRHLMVAVWLGALASACSHHGTPAPPPDGPSYVLGLSSAGDGTTTPPAGAYAYAAGTRIQVTAQPNAGARFTGWSGAATGSENPVTVVMDGDKVLTAEFAATDPVLHFLTLDAGAGGSVSPAPGTYSYAAGTPVQVTATPDDGFTFTGWSGAATGTDNPVTVVMDGDRTLTAAFAAVDPTLEFVLSLSATAVTVAPGGSARTTVALARAAGSAVPVALAASGLPAGVTATFEPDRTTGATSVLTLTAAAAAAEGAATITVTGTSGSVSRSAPLALTVKAPTAPDTTPPTVPEGLTVTARTTSSVSLAWTASSDGATGSGVAGYDVFQDGKLVVSTTAPAVTVTGLTLGTRYVFAVEARDVAGNVSGASSPVTVTTLSDTTPPTAPAGLALTGTTLTSASLAWTASTDDVGVVDYHVFVDGAFVASTATTAATVTRLRAGTSYTFTVKARDAASNVSAASGAVTASTLSPPGDHFVLEDLDRGVVAVQVAGGVYVGWRMLGQEYDATTPSNVAYALYRDGTRIATVSASTNHLDGSGTAASSYAVSPVIGGVEGPRSAAATVWTQPYLRIPLAVPPGGVTPASCVNPGEAYTYSANDASVGDLDGDGEYELVLKWDPSNSKDSGLPGCTGNVFLDAYELSGARLWRMDLGVNVRAGAHYTQFVVYDLDGDGKAEVALKTAPGARDGTGVYLHTGPAASDDDQADHRDANGLVLTGPEYLTVFAGPTGAELATVGFDVPRGAVSAWGDSYGNRVDRFLASAAFVQDSRGGASGRPSVLMARGYYERSTITAWSWRGGALTELWRSDSDAGTNYTGQGYHMMPVADVDGDGAQEIIYGASVINADGTKRCSTGFGHGDALHVADLVPPRPGLEVFGVHEGATQPSYDLHDASTCEVLQRGPVSGLDTGRGLADAILPGAEGAQLWSGGYSNSAKSARPPVVSATTGASVGVNPTGVKVNGVTVNPNFLVWWDADEARELLDNTAVTKYAAAGTMTPILSCAACAADNGTKATPVLTADLLGDWREEIVWREADSSALRVYTTTDVTARRIYTLMHDAQYRAQVSAEQTSYNQPPHPSFYIGPGMAAPPAPSLRFRP